MCRRIYRLFNTSIMLMQIVLIICLETTTTEEDSRILLRWCVARTENEKLCWDMASDLERDGQAVKISCVRAKHVFDCMRMVHSGGADATNLNAEETYVGGRYFNLRPILYGQIGDFDFFTEDAVVVIRRSSFRSRRGGLRLMRGKKLCLPSAETNSLQMQALVNVLLPLGFMNVYDYHCESPLPSIASYFGSSCAPGRWSLDDYSRRQFITLCRGCHQVCTEQDYFEGVKGALRCLEAGAEVAVSSSAAVAEMDLDPMFYERLCIQGTRRLLNNTCAWMGRRTSAVVVAENMANDTQAKLKNGLAQIYTKYRDKAKWIRGVLFRGELFTSVEEVDEYETYETYLGQVFSRSMETPFPSVDCGSPRRIRWCVSLRKKMDKCEAMAVAFHSRRLTPHITCVRARTTNECVRLVSFGRADVTLLPPETAVSAKHRHNLSPVAVERYEDGKNASGYLIAVINRRKNVTISSLLGAQTCHTGADDPFGFQAPLVILERLLGLRSGGCDFVGTASELFWKTCVPGTRPDGSNHDNVCGLCAHDCGMHGRFYGAQGALRCMRQVDGGDVTFLTNDSLALIDHNDPRFALLCLDGSHRALQDYENCHWLRIPPRVLAVSAEFMLIEERHEISQFLLEAQRHFGNVSDNTGFSMFSTAHDDSSVFSYNTRYLEPVWPNEPLSKALGEVFEEVFERVLHCSPASTIHWNFLLVFVVIAAQWFV